MPTTLVELVLTPFYRQAQRLLAEWLERGQAGSRRQAFKARTALSRLDAAERHKMARWLAWLWAAELSHGDTGLGARIRYLDSTFYALVREAAQRLPGAASSAIEEQRLSA